MFCGICALSLSCELLGSDGEKERRGGGGHGEHVLESHAAGLGRSALGRGRVRAAPRSPSRISHRRQPAASVVFPANSSARSGASSLHRLSARAYLFAQVLCRLISGNFIAVLPPSNICYHVSRFLLVPFCFHNDRR